MKAFFYIITWFLIFNFKAFSDEITFNCKFDKWVEQKMMEEIYKSKDDLSPAITTDKQITFEKISETELFVLETNFIHDKIIKKIEVNIMKNELFFSNRVSENHLEIYSLNRLSGDLIRNVKRFDEKVTVYYKCEKTDKLI